MKQIFHYYENIVLWKQNTEGKYVTKRNYAIVIVLKNFKQNIFLLKILSKVFYVNGLTLKKNPVQFHFYASSQHEEISDFTVGDLNLS